MYALSYNKLVKSPLKRFVYSTHTKRAKENKRKREVIREEK